MNRINRIGTNIFFYGLGKVYDTVAALIWIALIARYLGRDGFGEYALILAVLTMAVVIPEIGLNNVLIREVSRNREEAPDLLKATIQVRRLLFLVSVLIVLLVIFASTKDRGVRISACIGSLWIWGRLTMGTNSAIFFAYERIQYDTVVTIFHCSAVVGFLYAATRLDLGLTGVIGALSLASALGGLLSFAVRRLYFCTAAKGSKRDMIRYILRESLPVGGTRALRLTGNRIDTLILSWLRTSGEVAIYSGVYNLILRIIQVPWLVSRPLFPLISQLARSPGEKERFQKVTGKSIKLMFVLAAPVCVGLTVTADKIVYLIFGPQFHESIGVMRILAWVLMFMFPSAMASFVVIAVNRQVYLLKTLGACIGLNIVLDFALVPLMGYYGPCAATLLAEVLFSFFLWKLLHEELPSLHLFEGYINIAAGACAMGAVLYSLHSLNLIVLILLGSVIYFPLLFLFKAFSPEEVNFFRNTLLRRRETAVEAQLEE